MCNIRDVDLHAYEETRRINRKANGDLSNGQLRYIGESQQQTITRSQNVLSCPVGDISIDVFNMVYLFYFILFIRGEKTERRNQNQIQFNISNKYLYVYVSMTKREKD